MYIEFVAKPTYELFCRATVEIFPGTFLFVSTGFLCIIFVIMVFLHIGMLKRKTTAAKTDDIE